jgi:P27 family predicted phage terminase small subunit
MKRGRRKDDPRDQAAKGYPGRRKSKTERELARMEAAAARDAKLFAIAGEGFDLQALPVFLADKRMQAAQTIWREYAPRLDRLHFLSTLDRYTFAMFCIYAAEYVLANKDILDKGYSIEVTTVAGAKMRKGSKGAQMPRLNPSVDRRDFAAKMMIDLSGKFGLTPMDRLKLTGLGARFDDDTLFGPGRATPRDPAAPQAEVPPPQPPASELVGALGALDSAPPKPRMN